MTRSASRFFAVSSVLLLALASKSATRPHYGGTLRVMLGSGPSSLDPTNPAMADPMTAARLVPLLFDRLTSFDNHGRLQPELATTWQADSENRRWQFWIRHGVSFQDGAPLNADAVVTSLRAANPEWNVRVVGDSVVIEMPEPAPTMPAQLALARNAIVRRRGEKLVGSGPFRVAEWQPNKKLALSAEENHWGGRPFLDSVEITLGQNLRQQMIAFELGKTDLIEIAPTQARKAMIEGRHVAGSAATDLIALVTIGQRLTPEQAPLLQALSLSIDRTSMQRVLLQGEAEGATTVLPNWMTGYAFLFSPERNLNRAAQLRSETRWQSPLTLAYDVLDSDAQLLAERVALNAREAGIPLEPASSARDPDLRLVRIPLQSSDARLALGGVATEAGLPVPKFDRNSWDEIYERERDLVQTYRIIPLLHVPDHVLIAPQVNGWQEDLLGSWHLERVWLESVHP